LFLSTESSAVLIEVNAQGNVDSSSSGNNLSWLEGSLGNANRIV
jgi:hypothetical protein